MLASQEVIHVITAAPRRQPKPLPALANPSRRPNGAEPALVLEFFGQVPSATDVAMGKVPRRDVDAYLRSIHDARDRSIIVRIDDVGGRSNEYLVIAQALLAHRQHVKAQIVGRCSSSAVFLALAADTRNIVENGSVLIHRAIRVCTAEQFEAIRRLSAEERNGINESLADTDDLTASLLCTRLGVSESTARAWMAEGRAWNATESLAKGFAIADDLEAA